MKNNKDIMCVYERRNKHGELSFELHCSGKDAYTKKYKVFVKRIKVPKELTGKKEIEKFRLQCQVEYKEKVEKLSKGILSFEDKKISFYDYAEQWVERIKLYNKEAYNHYIHSKYNLKIFKEKFGRFTLAEMTLPIIQNFCDWLCTRTYKKDTIIVKESLRATIKEKGLTLKNVAENCGMATNTLTLAIEEGKHVARITAEKLCAFLNVPIIKYFTIISEDVPYSKTANDGLKVMLHTILSQAVKDGLIPINYASSEYTHKVTGTVGKKEIFETQDEIRNFIECLAKEPDIRKKVAFSIGLNLGLRGAEITGLSWQDIDFEKGTISINKNTIYVGGFGVVTKSTKNKSSTRIINMPQSLINLLQKYYIWWLEQKTSHGDLWANTDKLFVQNNGKDMSNSTISVWLKEFEIKNNLKKVTLHGLRHTNITMLILNGVDIKTVASRVGHSDVQTTLNIYSHFTNQSDKKASETIEQLLYAPASI